MQDDTSSDLNFSTSQSESYPHDTVETKFVTSNSKKKEVLPTYREDEVPFDLNELDLIPAEVNNFTLMPNGIWKFHVQEIQEDGSLKWVPLSPYAKLVYLYLRTLAGQTNVAWPTTQKIADEIGVSTASVVRAKSELSQPCLEMCGEPLIRIMYYTKKFTREDGTEGATTKHRCTISLVWGANYKACSSVHNSHPSEGSRFCQKLDGGSHFCEKDDSPRSRFCGKRITNTDKDSLIREKEPLDAVDNPCGKDGIAYEESLKSSEMLKAVYSTLYDQGAKPGFLEELFRRNPVTKLYRAMMYCRNRELAGKLRSGWIGYFRKTLDNGWAEENES